MLLATRYRYERGTLARKRIFSRILAPVAIESRRTDAFHQPAAFRTGSRRSVVAAELVTAVDALVDERLHGLSVGKYCAEAHEVVCHSHAERATALDQRAPTSHRTEIAMPALRGLISQASWAPHRISSEVGDFGSPLRHENRGSGIAHSSIGVMRICPSTE